MRREVVRNLVSETQCTIVALQEIKMALLDAQTVNETLGRQFTENFICLPAQQTRVGVLLAVHQDHYRIKQNLVENFSISARIEATTSQTEW